MNPVIFREYDIRGVVGKDFDAKFAEELGRAAITFLKRRKKVETPHITLGHDARLSSPELVQGVARGLMAAGARVTHLGLVTTPISYFSTFAMKDVDGAFMITGSHNPPEYNGFKISIGNSTIYGESIQELRQIIEAKDYHSGKGSEEKFDIFPTYIQRYKEEFGHLKPIPLVLDCGNGAAGCIARRLYEGVGLKPSILFEKPDGTFPNHHPDPTVEENLHDLVAEVKKIGAVAGIGFDGDADRIGLVDQNGRMIYGDELMVLISRSILKKNPGATIIGDVKCSDRLYADIEKNGGRGIMWKTGHSLIKQKIKDEKAPFGGEMSGHVFFADRNYGYDDALYAGLRVAEILSRTGQTIEQLLEGLPPAFNTPELRVDTTEEKKVKIVQALIERYPQGKGNYKLNLTDGIRLSFPDGWALARASNTQPVLVLRFESETKHGLERIQNEIEGFVKTLL